MLLIFIWLTPIEIEQLPSAVVSLVKVLLGIPEESVALIPLRENIALIPLLENIALTALLENIA
ncbi:hypothetical protein FIV49_15755 [Cylindrospermopsis raciborskii GIHE 2018]|nr:hypothetical protein FIV49_15755 [Cylindrospermopsis raciborskii GIHE 2018]